jgi:DeoR/GlpR family transcriptional regulator of sugar metabolism
MEVSRRQALIADSSKFTRSARLEIARLDSFDLIVTDAVLPPALRERIGEERLMLAAHDRAGPAMLRRAMI